MKPNELAHSILLALNTPPRVYAMSCALAAMERTPYRRAMLLAA